MLGELRKKLGLIEKPYLYNFINLKHYVKECRKHHKLQFKRGKKRKKKEGNRPKVETHCRICQQELPDKLNGAKASDTLWHWRSQLKSLPPTESNQSSPPANAPLPVAMPTQSLPCTCPLKNKTAH